MSRNARTVFLPLANTNASLAATGEFFVDTTNPDRPILFWKDSSGTLRNLSEPTAVSAALPTVFNSGMTVGGIADFTNASETRLGTVKLNSGKLFDLANARVKNLIDPIADDNPVSLGYLKTFVNSSRKELVIPQAQFVLNAGVYSKQITFAALNIQSVFFVQMYSAVGKLITDDFDVIVDNTAQVITIATATANLTGAVVLRAA